MDGFMLVIWVIRILFLVLLYIFLARIARILLRDLRAAARAQGSAYGRVVVTASPSGEPAQGRSFDLDTITTLGRDVNNAIVIDDPFASFEHAVLTYRGRGWYIEDLQSTNGTFVNGRAVGSVLPLGFGDEIAIGQVRLRLERARSA